MAVVQQHSSSRIQVISFQIDVDVHTAIEKPLENSLHLLDLLSIGLSKTSITDLFCRFFFSNCMYM